MEQGEENRQLAEEPLQEESQQNVEKRKR